MESSDVFAESRRKYQGENRAKLVMQRLRAYQQLKQQRKWWQRLQPAPVAKTKPKAWTQRHQCSASCQTTSPAQADA
ncbi:hypothetical protein CBW46_011545 [Paenibacillus xerothermodurans]|uniref:Uncharacterized protein n=1 Tax=Paenibacillus xerothermodurans TaxID=1977292 RepID=A0A2W1N8S8_PAEXE|nr:hypothetical protein CBW46_011545 [Paenibacillus xerothermodurans]